MKEAIETDRNKRRWIRKDNYDKCRRSQFEYRGCQRCFGAKVLEKYCF